MTTGAAVRPLLSSLEPQLDRYLRDLAELCAIDCPTEYKAGVDRAADWVQAWAERRGWETLRWPDEDRGDSVVATLNGRDENGPNLLLVAHLDTVYPVGIARERPLRRVGDMLIGPGTADNKSGLLSGLYAMGTLENLDLLDSFAAVSLVCGSDEETDMRSSAALLRELAPRYHAALVLECGRENGDIVSARKGAGQFVIEVEGRSAHAGVEPHRGASAVLALAQITVALHLLNGRPPGATLNVGVVQGGTARNVVPDAARAEVDVRVALPEDMEVMEAAIRSVAHASPVPGTRAEVSGGWTTSPMARTPAVSRLVEVAVEAGQDLGIEIGDAATGGVSYANLLASLSVPVLDGLGPVGGLDHSPREYIEVSSIVPRTALLALLLERYARGLQTTRDRLRQT